MDQSPFKTRPYDVSMKDPVDWEDIIAALKSETEADARRLDEESSRIQSISINLQDINFDDARFRSHIVKAGVRSFDRNSVLGLWNEYQEPERKAQDREIELSSAAFRQSAKLQYFTVTNRRGRTLHILADNAEVARYIAHQDGIISDRTSGNLRRYDAPAIEKLQHATAMQQALHARYPGVIEIFGDKVVHQSRKHVFG